MQSPTGPGNSGRPFNPPYNAPIPPAGPPPGGYGFGGPAQSGPPQIRFDVIGQAWSLVKDSLGVWIPAFLIYAVIVGVVSAIFAALTGGTATPTPRPGADPFGTGGAAAVPNIPVMIIGQLIQLVVTQFLIGGLYRMAINQVRGQMPSIGDMFSVSDVLPALLVASILSSIAMVLGFLLCVIPGLLLSGCLMFTIPLIVDRRLGGVEAMQLSFNTLKSQALMAFLFLLVVGIVSGLGVLLCGIGVLVTAPIGIVAVALLYRDFFGGEVTVQPSYGFNQMPPPPIPPV